MTRKLILISVVLVGFVLAQGSNAWADCSGHGKHQYYGKGYHHYHKAQLGHHHDWAKGKGHHKHFYRHHRACSHRDYRRPLVVEKHVYHYYQAEELIEDEGFKFGFSVANDEGGVSVEVRQVY
jgi:hypothetical protein